MRLMKGIAIAGVSSLVVAMSYGCSSTTTIVDNDSGITPGNDSGIIKKDTGPGNETGPQPEAGGVCGPVDTTAYVPRPYGPPSGKHQKKCTAQNLTDYVACQGGDKTKCTQFGNGMAAAGCGSCIETQSTDATWGPLVFTGMAGYFNVQGCLDLVVPNTTCGKTLDADFGCQDFACAACDKTTTPDTTTCSTSARGKQCKTYVDAVKTACAAQDAQGDAAPADIATCGPDGSIADPKMQQLDWIGRMAAYFCGP